MKVLNIVPTKHTAFFNDQVNVLRDLGVEVDVIDVPSPNPKTAPKSGKNSRSVLHYLKFYSRVLGRTFEDYDIVHANYGLVAPFGILQRHRPLVLTLWGSDLMGKYGWMGNYCAKACDEVVLPSPVMEPDLDTDSTLVPFGVDIDRFRPIPKAEAREEVNWNQNERIVLFPYPPTEGVKNYELANEVVDQVDVDHTVDLRYISGVSHERVPYYLNAADAVLITSKRESGPMVVKEAALCNTPVVSTDVGFVDTALADVANSFVCRSKQELVLNIEFVLETGVESDGRKCASDWGFEQMGKALIEVYERALE